MFITGGNENTVAFWDVTDSTTVASNGVPFGNGMCNRNSRCHLL